MQNYLQEMLIIIRIEFNGVNFAAPTAIFREVAQTDKYLLAEISATRNLLGFSNYEH